MDREDRIVQALGRVEADELFDEEQYEAAAEYEAERAKERQKLSDDEMDAIEAYFLSDDGTNHLDTFFG